MSSNQLWARSAALRQRLLVTVALVAVVAAWRERAFARNRSRYGGAHPPEPRA